jgi:hypothetical protein
MSEIDDIFKFNCGLRFLDKQHNCNERDNYKGWWLEQIYQYGTVIDYYINSTSLKTADPIYGEEPTQTFKDPKKLIFALTLNENSVVLQKFGLMADDELTGFIPIESYTLAMATPENPHPEPKAGDVIELTEFGSSRPGGRGAKKFEITERLDQDVEQMNPLLGHYVWLIKGKRFDFSYEEGIAPEPQSQQVADDDYYGKLPGSGDSTQQQNSTDNAYQDPTSTGVENITPEVNDDTLYFNDVDRASRNIFDYSVYGDYDDIYGGYDG